MGGGLESDGLANCALRWIVEEAGIAGLELRKDFLAFFGEFALDAASGKSIGFKLADAVFRPVRGFNGVRDLRKPAGMTVDRTVFERLNGAPNQSKKLGGPYRPENLLQFLAAHDEHDASLGPNALAAVKKLRTG